MRVTSSVDLTDGVHEDLVLTETDEHGAVTVTRGCTVTVESNDQGHKSITVDRPDVVRR